MFDHESIRQHLTVCLENCQFLCFPVLGEQHKIHSKAIHVYTCGRAICIYVPCRHAFKAGHPLGLILLKFLVFNMALLVWGCDVCLGWEYLSFTCSHG